MDNISRIGKWIVAFVAGIVLLIGGVKTISEWVQHFNPWHFMMGAGFLVLMVLAIDQFFQWLAKRFLLVEQKIAALRDADHALSQEVNRVTGALSSQCDQRISAVADKERNDRTTWIESVNDRENGLQTRIEKMEAWFRSKNVPI